MAFGRPKPFDRTETLEAADKARSKGRRVKAIAGYQKILEHHPEDAAVHGKLAPLLADAKRSTEALTSFRAAALAHTTQGFADRAISVYVQALGYYPKELAFWEEVVALHLKRGRKADALKALLDARARFGRKPDRPIAKRLLRRALEIDDAHVGATADLARLLAKDGSAAEALDLLRQLLSKVEGRDRRVLRRAEFSVAPSPATLWRWWFGG
jgi:tetratricopeptide (TPR) repeat protein